MSMSFPEFQQLAADIQATSHCDEATALHYARLVPLATRTKDGKSLVLREADPANPDAAWNERPIVATIPDPFPRRSAEPTRTRGDAGGLKDITFDSFNLTAETADGEVATLTWNADDSVALLDDVPTENFILRELAARWFLWSRDLLPESVAENPRALSESDAMEALENHLAAMVEANLIDP